MKKVLFLLLATFLLFLPFFTPHQVAAAAPDMVKYGKEMGEWQSEGNIINYWDALIAGVCSEGSTIPDSTPQYLWPFISLWETVTSYLGGMTCPRPVSYEHSALANLSNTTLALFQPPVSTYAFFRDMGETLGFVPKSAQAQGIGFSGLSVLLPIWKAFRNVAYALLAVILVVIGFMVMFRKKIDPKTVVTVQNAIPRVIVALLLVTFSYAIVGLMIDLMYLFIVLSASLIASASGDSLGFLVNWTSGASNQFLWSPNILHPETWLPQIQNGTITPSQLVNVLLNGGIGKMILFFFGSGFQAFDDIGRLLTGNLNPVATAATSILPGILGFLIAGGGKTGLIVSAFTNGPALLLLIILIILLFGIIRLIFMLVDAYINIIISLLFSPFQLMLEAVPGTNAFSSWFRWLLAKVVTFPITAILLMVAAFLTSQNNATELWAPPLLSGGGGTTGLAGFIGLGMLLVIPSVVGSIQKALKAEPFIPGGVGAVVGPIGSGAGQLFQLGYQFSFISSAIRHKPDARSPMQTAREGFQKGVGSFTGGGGEGGH